MEGSVVNGVVVAIENDFALIDVGLKCEGRVPMKEFAGPGRAPEIKVGDVVEVFLDRIENAQGEAVISRDKARRDRSEEHTSELQSLMRISYAVFCLKKKHIKKQQ